MEIGEIRVILDRCGRFLIVDPNGHDIDVSTWPLLLLENHIMLASKLTNASLYILLNPVCQKTTFLDKAFIKTLGGDVRFGTPSC